MKKALAARMVERSRMLLVAALFACISTFAFAQQAVEQVDIEYVQRATQQLAARNKGIALFTFLEQSVPSYHQLASKAGLQNVLDGKGNIQDFLTKWDATFRAQVQSARLTTQTQASLKQIHDAVTSALQGHKLSAQQGRTTVGEFLQIPAQSQLDSRIAELRKTMWDASKHPFAFWETGKINPINIKYTTQGEVVWFNPDISIPELGIARGKPLTSAQKDALVRVFGVTTTFDAAQVEGSAVFPKGVGRAINPVPNELVIISKSGTVIPDLVLKGTGKNKASDYRDGRYDISEGYVDAEISRALYRAGVNDYLALAIIELTDVPGKAIYVRAPRSMLRHEGLDPLTPQELLKTLEVVARETAIIEQKPPMSVREWAERWLPAATGKNAGILSALGVKHESIYGRDNHGLGETVDWSGGRSLTARLGQPISDAQKGDFWSKVEQTLRLVNDALRFEALQKVPENKLVELATQHNVDPFRSMSKEDLLSTLTQGRKPDLGSLSVYDLRKLATENGIRDTANMEKPAILSQLAKKPSVQLDSLSEWTLKSLAEGNRLQLNDVPKDVLRRVLSKSDSVVPANYKPIATDKAKQVFEEAYNSGKEQIVREGRKVTLSSEVLGKVSGPEYISALVDGFGLQNTSSMTKDQVISELAKRGVAVSETDAIQNANATARRQALETLTLTTQTAPASSPRWRLINRLAAVTAFPAVALQSARKPFANVSKSKVASSMKGHALGAANFGTALFLKELMVAAETRNLDGITALGHEMATPRFWASYGAFVVGARASQVGFEKLLAQMAPKILRGVLRSNIALAGGLLAMELLNGTFEPKRFAVTFGSLFVASTIVHAVKWALIGGLVFTGPVGWIILAVDLAVTLYLADKIEGLFTKWLQKAEKSSEDKNLRPELRSVTAPTTGGGGIAEQLEQINEFLDNFSAPPLTQPAE